MGEGSGVFFFYVSLVQGVLDLSETEIADDVVFLTVVPDHKEVEVQGSLRGHRSSNLGYAFLSL